MSPDQLNLLLSVIDESQLLPPADIAGALAALPEVERLPSPWATWTLLGLVRHRERQLWVGEIVVSRLRGNLQEIGRMGAFGHPQEIPQTGVVPGFAEWEYYFHGVGCCLTHRVSGESIDVDFVGDSAEYFDTFFYQNYLRSLREPAAPERRLLDLHPSIKTLYLSVARLLQAGALTRSGERGGYRIATEVLAHAPALDAFCSRWSEASQHVWLAALIGDWLAAHEAAVEAGDRDIVQLTETRRRQTRARRQSELNRTLQNSDSAADALLALDDLNADDLPVALEKALNGPPTSFTSAALEIIGRRQDKAWCEKLNELFRRLNPNGPPPEPHLWMACLRFQLQHGYQTEKMLAALSRAAGYEIGEAVLLALEHAPALALPLIRRALRSQAPANRTMVAAILALIDRPWSRQELLAVLDISADHRHTADCRAALLECHDPAAHAAVAAWEVRYPRTPEAGSHVTIAGREFGPCFTFEELDLRHRSEHLRWEMQKWHDRVMPLRDVAPPEPAKKWWKWW